MPKASYDLVLLPGDGIGVEVIGHARTLIDLIASTTGAAFSIDEIPCGGKFYLEHGSRDWPEDAEKRCQAADAILLGAVGWNGPNGAPVTMRDAQGQEKMAGWSPVIGNRINLDLYANIRPVHCLPGTKHGLSGKFREVWSPETVDMVIVRENTEDLYCGISERTADRATDLRVITRRASERVIHTAFELSRRRGKGAPGDGKRRVTCIVKHNVLAGCRLFLEVFREVAKHYPDIEPDVAIVDSFAMFVLTQPERYDVCVTTNMFGDILTDLASVLAGGMGMAVGCNVGDHHAMFEPIHGSAPPLMGKDRANPMAMLLATGEAMAWLGRKFSDDRLLRAHAAVEAAVATLVERGAPLTADLGGTAPQSVVAEAVHSEVRRQLGG
ncbi:MAG TPA: isocitrate/isopropylmalate family dehydrogenase [Kofleriaceae bacterium]|jgi:3-isopropylmalate dehydrogenase|nr:isocitrate/isopropylmalate family dehydrogenase [Kofleriaceae bacterium]